MTSPITVRKAVWITDPRALFNIDLKDASSIDNYTSITDENLKMETQGWRQIGTCDMAYNIHKTPQQLAQDAVDAAQQAMQKLQADTEVKLNALRETVSKLQALDWNGQSAADVTVASDAVYSNDKQPAPAPDWREVIAEERWECVKTGCQLLLLDNGINIDSYWGDLFFDNSTQEYLFNCANEDPLLSRFAGESPYCITTDVGDKNFTTSYCGLPRFFVFDAAEAGRSADLITYIEGSVQ